MLLVTLSIDRSNSNLFVCESRYESGPID